MVVSLSSDSIKLLHKIILESDPHASPGFMNENMIEGSMERALTQVYNFEPFPSVLEKAAVLMYSIIVFHPFIDGNKRTALLATYFFLFFNGYSLNLSEEVVQVVLKIADGKMDEKAILEWLKKNTRRPFILRIFMRLFASRIGKVVSLEKMQPAISNVTIQLLEFTKKAWQKVPSS